MTETWQTLFIDYANDLEKYWQKDRIRQIEKFSKKLDAFKDRISAKSRKKAIKKCIAICEARESNRPLTTFLISPGSSGSHWLEAVCISH